MSIRCKAAHAQPVVEDVYTDHLTKEVQAH